MSSVLRLRQACKTERERATLPSARKRRYADEVMGMLAQEEKARYANVGRNDPCPCGSGKKFKGHNNENHIQTKPHRRRAR